MRRINLRLRLVLPLACVLLVYGGLQTYFIATTQRDEIFKEATLAVLRLATTVRRSTRNAMLQSRREDVHRMIEEIGAESGIEHVRIFNKEGVIMFSSDHNEINRTVDRTAEACYQCHDLERPLTTLETSQRSRVFEAASGCRTLAAIEVIYNEPACWSAACHAHTAQQELLGVIDIGVSLQEADARVSRTTREAVLLGIVSTVGICLVGALLVHRLVNTPVRRLLECTRQVAQGNLDCQIRVTSNDELGQLTAAFVKMTEDLRSARTELNQWALKLEEEVDQKTEELKVAQAQVLRSEKLSSVGLLAAGVAHELNSPLTGILTFAHILARRYPDGAPEKEKLQVIADQAERCAKIIRQLLDLSRERPLERNLRDLPEILEQAIALVAHHPRFRKVSIERRIDPGLPKIWVDTGQMQQVFLNLLVNAGEAMPSGGQLRIEMERAPCPRGPSASTAAAQVDGIRITVTDSGVGIPAELLDRIFDPFFTSKEVGQGTGLGLAVSHGIIEKHGGTIRVTSTPGRGTSFVIHLPLGGETLQTAGKQSVGR